MYIYQLKIENSPRTTDSEDIYNALVETNRLRWGFNISQVPVGHWYVKEHVCEDLALEIMSWNENSVTNMTLVKAFTIFRRVWLKKMVEIMKPLYNNSVETIGYIYNMILPICPVGHVLIGSDIYAPIFRPNPFIRPWFYEQFITNCTYDNMVDMRISSDQMSYGMKLRTPTKDIKVLIVDSTWIRNYGNFQHHDENYDVSLPHISFKAEFLNEIYIKESINSKIQHFHKILDKIDEKFRYYLEYPVLCISNRDNDQDEDLCRIIYDYPNIYNFEGKLLYTCPYEYDNQIVGQEQLIAWDMTNFIYNLDKYAHKLKYRLCVKKYSRGWYFNVSNYDKGYSIMYVPRAYCTYNSRCLNNYRRELKTENVSEIVEKIRRDIRCLLISAHKYKKRSYITIMDRTDYEEMDYDCSLYAYPIDAKITVEKLIEECNIKYIEDVYDKNSGITWKLCRFYWKNINVVEDWLS